MKKKSVYLLLILEQYHFTITGETKHSAYAVCPFDMVKGKHLILSSVK